MQLPAQKWRGGARIGLINATWPFADLRVGSEHLLLKVMFLGTYVFRPEQVASVEPYGLIPFVGKGIRIHHRVDGYPEKIVFWYFCVNAQPIVDASRQYGYGA
jgi:hypothetical protein